MTRTSKIRRGARAAFLLALGVVAGTAAHAVTVDWGDLAPARIGAQAAANGAFIDDLYTFTLGSAGLVSSSAVALDLSTPSNATYLLVGGSYDLLRDPDGIAGNGDESSVRGLPWSFDSASGGLSNQVSLAAGHYYFEVAGLALGDQGAAYQIGATVTAVPEPATSALLLAGGAAMAWVARRRRRD